MQAYIVWNVSPEIFSLGPISIRWYGLMFVFSFYFGFVIVQQMFRREQISEKLLDNLALWMILATIIGARLGHVLFYEPEYYLSHPLKILKVWEGGLASHGAAVSIILTLYWFSKKYNWSTLWLIDRITVPVALAGFFIRMGNLMNSEVFGKPTTLPWGFVFSSYDEIPRHPSQLYEALSYLLIFGYLYRYYLSTKGNPPKGYLFGMFLSLIFGVRILIEFLKEPQVDFEQSMWLNMGQWLSIPFVLIGAYFVVRAVKSEGSPPVSDR